jgi:hypothetical protein
VPKPRIYGHIAYNVFPDPKLILNGEVDMRDPGGDTREVAQSNPFEQQNVRLPASTKRHLVRLAAEAGTTLPKYLVGVLSEHVRERRQELASIYQEDAARAAAAAAELARELADVEQRNERRAARSTGPTAAAAPR